MQLRAISGVKKANPLLNAMRSSQTKIESILLLDRIKVPDTPGGRSHC
jgi:hypothetical protein